MMKRGYIKQEQDNKAKLAGKVFKHNWFDYC